MSSLGTDAKCIICNGSFIQGQSIIYTQCGKVTRLRQRQRWVRSVIDPVTKQTIVNGHYETIGTAVTTYVEVTGGMSNRGAGHIDCFKGLIQENNIEDITIPLKERKAARKVAAKKPKPPRPGRLEHLDED